MIVSPCISICKTDPKSGYCYGCGRTNEEKKIWKLEETSDQWKKDKIFNFFHVCQLKINLLKI